MRHGTNMIGQTQLHLSLLRCQSRAGILPPSSGAAWQEADGPNVTGVTFLIPYALTVRTASENIIMRDLFTITYHIQRTIAVRTVLVRNNGRR